MVRFSAMLCLLVAHGAGCGTSSPAAERGGQSGPARGEPPATLRVRCLEAEVGLREALRRGRGVLPAARALVAAHGRLRAAAGAREARGGACDRAAARTLGQAAQLLYINDKDGEGTYEILAAWASHFARGDPDVTPLMILARMQEKRRRWQEAARTYARIVSLAPRGKHARAVAQAAVAMWSRTLTGIRRSPGERARPLDRNERGYHDAIVVLLRYVRKGALRADLLFRRAQLLYSAGRLEGALPICETIVTQHDKSAQAPHAALMLLDVLSRQNKRAEMMSWVERLSRRRVFARGNLGRTLRKLRLHSSHSAAQADADAGRFAACAKRYLAIAATRGAERPALALLNAAACQQSAGDLQRAITTRQRLMVRYPKSAFAAKALLQNGEAQIKLGKDEAASRCFESYARRYPDDPLAPSALLKAINARLRMGRFKQALALLRRMQRQYAKRYPRLLSEARKVVEGARKASKGLDATVKPE